MPDYDLGTARGKIDVDGEGAVTGFGKAETAQTKWAKGAKVAGAVVTGAGIAIAAGLGLAINSAANFEERMSAVEAVSGASGKELDKLREKALQLGADTKFSATEAAGAIEELVKAGLPVADVLNGAADATVNLAAAGEIDLAQAATIAANAMNAFNLEGKDMEHVADLIAGAANASAIDVGEFGQSLQQAGATANLVGLTFDDLTLAIAAMGNAGIKGSDAGTSLKTFLANLQPTTVKQIELFKELGLLTEDMGNQFFDAQGKIKPMREIAETLQNALAGMTDQQKALTLETLFGSDAIRAAAIIAGEGAEGFDELATSIGKVSAEEVAETRMDNLRGSIEQLKGSVETLAIRFGTPMLNAIRGFVDFLTQLANKFSELNPNIQKAIGIIAAIAAAFLLVLGPILLLVGWLGTIAAAVGLTVGALVGIIAIAFAVVVAIVALVAAIVILYRENETFRNIVQGVWNFIKDTVLTIIENVIEGVQALIQAFKGEGITSDGFVGVMERIGVAAKAVVDFFTDTVIPAIQWFAREFMERFRSASEWLEANVFPVFTALGELIQGVVRLIIGAVNVLWPVFQATFSAIVTVVTTAFNIIKIAVETFVNIVLIIWNNFGSVIFAAVQTVWNALVGIIQGALSIIQGIIQVFTGLITLNWSQVWEGIKNIVSGVWEIIKTIVSTAVAFVQITIDAAIAVIKTSWEAGWELIKGIIEIAWELIKNIVQIAVDFMKATIEAAINLVQNIWNAAWSAIIGILYSAWETMKSATTTALNAIVGFITGFPSAAWNALSGVATTLYDRGTALITGLKNGIVFIVGELVGYFMALPGKIVGWLGDLGSTLYNAGKNLITGFIDGIKSKIGSVQSALGGITSSLTSWKGPPRKDRVILEPVGELVMSGFIRGIQKQIEPLKRMLANVTVTTLKTMGSMTKSVSDIGKAAAEIRRHLEAGGRVQEDFAFRGMSDLVRQFNDDLAVAFNQGRGPDENAWTNPWLTADWLRRFEESQTTLAPAPTQGADVTIQLNFPNVTSAAEAEAVKSALNDADVLSRLIHATRAGVGSR